MVDESHEDGGQGQPPAPETTDEHAKQEALTAEDLAVVRELALRAHPDAVPELVAGGSLAELLASLEPARAAYRRIAEAAPPPVVPAGSAPRAVVDPDLLPATEKIRRGLVARGQ